MSSLAPQHRPGADPAQRQGHERPEHRGEVDVARLAELLLLGEEGHDETDHAEHGQQEERGDLALSDPGVPLAERCVRCVSRGLGGLVAVPLPIAVSRGVQVGATAAVGVAARRDVGFAGVAWTAGLIARAR